MTDLPMVPDMRDEDVAFEVWLYLAGRNATRTAEILSQPPGPMEQFDRQPKAIPARTVRDWVKRHNWEIKAEQRLKEAAPGIHARVVQEIIIGSLQAVQLERDIIEGKVEVSDKVRHDAAKTMLDRAGHLPWTRGSDGSVPTGPTRNYAESVAGKTTEEIAKMLFGGGDEE